MSTSATDTLAAYKKKGLAGRVGFGRSPAIIVVDFIIGFTDRRSPLAADFSREITAVRKILNVARSARLPVFFTTVAYAPDLTDAGVFIKKIPSLRYLKEGSKWVELDPRLGRKPSEIIINKKYASAFFGTALASTLNTLRVDTLIVTGCTTSGCVRATAVDGLQYGLHVIIPRECVGDRARDAHEANLVDIDGKYGDVMNVAQVLAHLRHTKKRG